MAVKKTSKEEILIESIKLFKKRGYYNTSMANIAEACGLIKGSIYHHFKSKDEIGLESLKYIHEYFEKNIYSLCDDESFTPKQKLEEFIKRTDEYFLHSEGGCLLGNLALEVSYENEEFKDEIKAYFSAWQNSFAKILETKYSHEEAINLSFEYMSLTQGAIMMMNLYGDSEEYLKVGKKFINLL